MNPSSVGVSPDSCKPVAHESKRVAHEFKKCVKTKVHRTWWEKTRSRLRPWRVALFCFLIACIWYWVSVCSYPLQRRFRGKGTPNERERLEATWAFSRRRLTEAASFFLTAVVVLGGFRAVDVAGYLLYYSHHAFGAVLSSVILTIFAVASRFSAISALLGKSTATLGPKVRGIAILAAGLVLLGAYLVKLSPISYWSIEKIHWWSSYNRGWIPFALALFCMVLSFALGQCRQRFLNLTTLHALYTARLTRTFLGASNPRRWGSADAGVTCPIEDDDVSLLKYKPFEEGGPLHIINSTVNETVSGESALEYRDRKGLPLAVSALAMSVGVSHHATLSSVTDPLRMQLTTLRDYGNSFELIPKAAIDAEAPSLGNWVGISGAAVSTGMGYMSSLKMSLVLAFLNVRLGYWWDSGIDPKRRNNKTPPSTIISGR